MPTDSSALILVDVLNGFFHPHGAMWYPEVSEVLPGIAQLLDRARSNGTLVVHVADRHRPEVVDAEFDRIPEHLPIGGFDAEFFEGFEPAGNEPVVQKRRYSAFFATDLALLLHENRKDNLVVVGVKTNVCIRATVTEGFAHGFHMVVPRQATNSNRRHLEEASIEDMERYLADVTSLEAALDLV